MKDRLKKRQAVGRDRLPAACFRGSGGSTPKRNMRKEGPVNKPGPLFAYLPAGWDFRRSARLSGVCRGAGGRESAAAAAAIVATAIVTATAVPVTAAAAADEQQDDDDNPASISAKTVHRDEPPLIDVPHTMTHPPFVLQPPGKTKKGSQLLPFKRITSYSITRCLRCT